MLKLFFPLKLLILVKSSYSNFKKNYSPQSESKLRSRVQPLVTPCPTPCDPVPNPS